MSPRTRNLLFGALGLAVVVVTFAVVLPRIASYSDVWAVLRTLDLAWLLALLAVVLLNIVTYAPPWMIALPGLRFRQALPFTQASTAFTYIAPGGGIVGMAGSYGLLRMWGFASNDVARAVTVTGIWNQLANLLLPVIAVMLLGIEGGRDAVLTTAAVIGASVFTVVVGALALVLWTDSLARAVGDLAERLASRLLAVVRRGPGPAASETWATRSISCFIARTKSPAAMPVVRSTSSSDAPPTQAAAVSAKPKSGVLRNLTRCCRSSAWRSVQSSAISSDTSSVVRSGNRGAGGSSLRLSKVRPDSTAASWAGSSPSQTPRRSDSLTSRSSSL